jgi:hypothetical protein
MAWEECTLKVIRYVYFFPYSVIVTSILYEVQKYIRILKNSLCRRVAHDKKQKYVADYVRFKVLTEVNMKNTVFLDVV